MSWNASLQSGAASHSSSRGCHSYLGFHILLLAVGHVGHVGTLGCVSVSGTNFEGKIRKLG